jgi:hypothetical protein
MEIFTWPSLSLSDPISSRRLPHVFLARPDPSGISLLQNACQKKEVKGLTAIRLGSVLD